jgi:hypothetical protein
MPLPQDIEIWEETLDPQDIAPFFINVDDYLLEGEVLATWSVTTTNDYGLEIGSGSYAPSLTSEVIKVWLKINESFQTNAAFKDAGIVLPVSLALTIQGSPNKPLNRTLGVRVIER